MLNIPLSVDKLVSRLAREGEAGLLLHGKTGLEKESLRVARTGGIAHTPHPAGLGSPLTHPWITTDYSEALLELITPPMAPDDALSFLHDLHIYSYQHLDEEILWSTSMPCVLAGGDNIPIAQYGNSNAGQMKYVYRVGLGNRYGRVMQVIAGVHYNYSFAEAFWPMYQQLLGSRETIRAFRDRHYMGLVRNLQRYGWLIPYLFGASPAVCKSFFIGKEPNLDVFDETTYYEPYATSLRMGDIGYQNSREEGLGIKADYDSLETYTESLIRAMTTPGPSWEEIGIKNDQGEYQQLNANLLQIENEYYSTVRPKQVVDGLEPPSLALNRRGIEYVELRSLDVNAYHPLGVDEVQLRFLQGLMIYCLLLESPVIGIQERKEIDRNLLRVAHYGRDPKLKLLCNGQGVSFRECATGVLEAMEPVMDLLDSLSDDGLYRTALDEQLAKVLDPDLTPSGRMLNEMRDKGEGFYQIARRLSQLQWNYFSRESLKAEQQRYLESLSRETVERQREMEASDSVDFDTFLAEYFSQ